MGKVTGMYQKFQEYIAEAEPTDIKILAEGDSWFKYPKKHIFSKPSNIIKHLSKKPDLLIFDTARNGDEISDMMSGKQKFDLLRRVKNLDIDQVLISGGGNDIVGRWDFGFLLNNKKDGMNWEACINKNRLGIKLNIIGSVYAELIERILDIKKDLKIITHTYDLAPPSNIGFELFDIFPFGDSWMLPHLKEKGITSPIQQKKIISYILGSFQETLIDIEGKYSSNFTVVKTQGTLNSNEWRNEIHPTPDGFKKIANKIYTEGIKPAHNKTNQSA